MKTPDWTQKALCRGAPQELWYPYRESEDINNYREARAICMRCPVRAECLQDAIVLEKKLGGGRHGMWGGRSPEERKELAKRLCLVVYAA